MNYQESLTINGKVYSGDELLHLAENKLSSQKITEYEKHLYLFIKEWISTSDKIKVKTSGTTGTPKEIVFLKSQAIASAKMTCNYFGLNKNTNALMSLSPEYIGGKMMVVRAFVSGMNLILVEPNSTPLKGLEGEIDFASMVPLQVYNSLHDEENRKKFISIPNIIIGGAPVSPALEKMLADCSNNVYSTFAMTESLSHIALKKLSGKDKADYYETLPGIQISIDERSCLVINALMLNENPIVTNDVVEIINPTQFCWLGRYDNVINSGGIKIHPEIIENKLASTITQNRFFISSLPDEKLGRKVIMVIECAEEFDVREIIIQTEKILSKYEIPKEYFSVDKFIETATGKIKKEETLKKAIKR